MKVSWNIPTALLLISLCSCDPKPFKTELGGYSIEFPITTGELKKQYPKGDTAVSLTRFVDSTQSVRAEWFFNIWGGTGGSGNPKGQPHGVNIFFKNKGNEFDSVKTSLESKFSRVLKPLSLHEVGNNSNKVIPPVYVCELSDDAILFLTKAASYRGDPWSKYNTIRVGIGYNLNAKQKELFALRGGNIYLDTD